jgi:hypothetical protein
MNPFSLGSVIGHAIAGLFKLAVCILLILFVMAVVSGCAGRVPVMAQDCEIARYKEMWEGDVEECKMASLKREDRAVERAKRQARKDACLAPMVWVGGLRDGSCRNPDAIILR